MPALIVIRGPNGAGKGTRTQFESADGRARLIDPDAIARRVNPTNPTLLAAAEGWEALLHRQEYLNGRISLAVETTLTGKSVLGLMREAKAADTVFIYYSLRLAALGYLSSVALRVSPLKLRSAYQLN